MAEMDMGLSPNNNNKKKRKKKKQSLGESLRTGLLPCKGDSSSEVARKLIFLGSLCLMIAALVIIAVHFISLLKHAPKVFWTVGLVQFFCWAAFMYMWTYTNGAIADEDGSVYIYYAASDTRLHVASTTIDKLLDFAFNTPADPLRSVDCVKQRCALIDKNLEYLKSIGE